MSTLHLKCSKSAQNRINKLIAATREHAFIGAQMPEAHEEIEEGFDKAKTNLEQFIARLEQRVSQK